MLLSYDELANDLILLQSTFLDDELTLRPAELDKCDNFDIVIACAHDPFDVLLHLQGHRDSDGQFEIESDVTDSAHSLTRTDQSMLNELCQQHLAKLSDLETPLYSCAVFLKEYLSEHSLRRPTEEKEVEKYKPKPKKRYRLKRVLFWSHHLLAVSKRKDIVAWSIELGLCGVSKPGYPGIIIVEGEEDDVDEFVARIKRLQWQALQIRCEEVEDVETLLGDDDSKVVDHVRSKARLGRPEDAKARVHEVETLAQVSAVMSQAGLSAIFNSAMKL